MSTVILTACVTHTLGGAFYIPTIIRLMGNKYCTGRDRVFVAFAFVLWLTAAGYTATFIISHR